eukprot:gnl/MRDRNA2_/MRDRNA2_277639_c0_seq1.p1 gnl/MRDRNA2_/MRDRNA2_277639_c0~~gnl/MRDRNA2_/MRDRNA2_277639_c0_seq1.p1  ORF type:complete len:245 (-),score=41.75 gnl/MRDRNA2_/MRDRNA2_277639_c0_seq1:42-680(-)
MERLKQYANSKGSTGMTLFGQSAAPTTDSQNQQPRLEAALSEGCGMTHWKQRRAQVKADRQAAAAELRVTYGEFVRQQHEQVSVGINPGVSRPPSASCKADAQTHGKADAQAKGKAHLALLTQGFGSIRSDRSMSSEVNHVAITSISENHPACTDVTDMSQDAKRQPCHRVQRRSKTWHQLQSQAHKPELVSPKTNGRSSWARISAKIYKTN